MKKLEKLTKKQEALLEVVRDRWIKSVYDCKPTNTRKARELIDYLYTKAGFGKPNIVFTDGIIDLFKKFRASVRDSVGASVWDSVRDSVGASVRASVWASVRDSVRDSVGASVRASVWASVWDSVGASVRDSVRDSVGASVRDSVGASVWDSVGDLSDFTWLSYYDFFNDIGVLDNKVFRYYKGLVLNSMICMCLMFKGVVFIVKMPVYIGYELKEGRRILHNTEGMALRFKDGSGIYSLHGIRFDKDLYDRVMGKSMDFKEVMAIENMEQRMVAMRYLDSGKLIEGAKGKVVNISERGYELIRFDGLFESSPVAYFLRYKCPSTGREYMTGIDPTFAKENENANRCAEWMMGLEVGGLKNIILAT